MPFTFSHPAAIIPINEKWKQYFCLTGLVLGSMSPDFEYFLNFRPVASIGHTFLGFLILNLPVCFALAYVFHMIIKRSLILHMPMPVSTRYRRIILRKWKLGSFRRVFVFIYSALLGMITHVFWDSFTHGGGVMVKLLPILSTKLSIMGYSIVLFKFLQHGSSVLGAIAIAYYLYKKRGSEISSPQIATRMKFLFVGLVTISGLLLTMIILKFGFVNIGTNSIGILVVTVINCMFFGLILTSLVSRLWTSIISDKA